MALRATASSQSLVGTATIVVLERSAEQVSPEALKFGITLGPEFSTPGPSGSNIHDPRYHDLYYRWDFGAGYDYAAPTAVIALAAHKNSRYGFGPKASHVYRLPGTYTVTCTVVEPATGRTAVATLDVTIGDPNTLFVGPGQTFVVDTTGAGLAAYPNAIVVTSLETVFTNISGNEATARRVILRRGQNFTLSGKNLGHSAGWPTVHFLAAEEAGAKPTVAVSGGQVWRDTTGTGTGRTKDLIWQNISFTGGWDSTTETGTVLDLFTIWTKPPMQFLLDGCRASGFGIGVYTIADAGGVTAGIYVNDTEVTNWQNYGLFPSLATTVSITGSAICQHVDALAGNTKNAGTYNHHGPVRIARTPDFLVHSSDFFSRNGWWQLPGPIQDQQTCLRYDTDAIGGGFASVQASILEGGSEVIKFTKDSGTIIDKPSNVVIEKNYLMASHASRQFMELSRSCQTIRNNICNFPPTQQLAGMSAGSTIYMRDTGTASSGENLSGPIRIYSNTFINQANTSIGTGSAVNEGNVFTNVIEANNLFVQVNAAPTSTSDGPLDQTPGFTPREKGYIQNAILGLYTTRQTGTATPAGAAWRGAPQVPSQALGAALTDPVACDDFFGQMRPQYPSRGALEAV